MNKLSFSSSKKMLVLVLIIAAIIAGYFYYASNKLVCFAFHKCEKKGGEKWKLKTFLSV